MYKIKYYFYCLIFRRYVLNDRLGVFAFSKRQIKRYIRKGKIPFKVTSIKTYREFKKSYEKVEE